MSRKGEIAKEILKVIGVSGIVIASVAIPSLPMAIGGALKIWKNINKKQLRRVIKRLEEQEMISIFEVDGKTKITITDNGRKRLLEYDYENLELKRKRRDGKWRIVIFDIPEYQKRNRDAFRRKLLELGFIRIQDSVFGSPYTCKEEIDFLCHYLEISDYVTVIIADKIERGEQLIFKNSDVYNGR